MPAALLAALTGLDADGVAGLVSECRRRSVASLVEGRVVIHTLTIAVVAATNADRSIEVMLNRAHTRLVAINLSDPVTFKQELPHYQALFVRVTDTLGLEDNSVLEFANILAGGYWTGGQFEEAILLTQENLAIMERVLGPEHPNTLTSRNNLASVYHVAGLLDEAIGLHEETLSIRERVLGLEHPDTLQSRNNLASYHALGRLPRRGPV